MENYFWNYMIAKGKLFQVGRETCIYPYFDNFSEQYVYLLEEGICALTSLSRDGGETVHLYFYPRRIISFNHHISNSRQHSIDEVRFTIMTKTNCTLYQIPLAAFQEMLCTNQDFNQYVMQTLATNYQEALIHLHWRVEKSAIARLCRLLLEISRHTGGTIPRFFTHAELAKYLGVHQVTVSRIMARFKQQGYIKKCPEGLSITDEQAFRTLIEGESQFKY